MKYPIRQLPIVLTLLLGVSCSQPSLEEALTNEDQDRIEAILNSGEFDPNQSPGGGDVTLFEFLIKGYDKGGIWAALVAKHRNLSGDSRNRAASSMMSNLSMKDGEVVIDYNYQQLLLREYFQALYELIKPLDSEASSLPKTTMGEDIFMIYANYRFYIFQPEGLATVKFDKPYETSNVLDIGQSPEYKDVVESSPGKELIFYVLHPAGMTPNYYVKVFADPFEGGALGNDVTFWNDKLLFAAKYNGDYQFDGSMEFPSNIEIEYNQLAEAADYEGYLNWIEKNLHSFSYSSSGDRPKTIPDRFQVYTDFEGFAPKALSRGVTDFGFDLVLLQSIYDYGEPTVNLKLAVYKDEKLLKANDLPESGEYMYDPSPEISLENGRVGVFREGYEETVTEAPPIATGGYTPRTFPDTTYAYTVDENGTLISVSDEITIQGNVMDRLSAKIELADFGVVRFTTAREEKLNLYLVREDIPVYQFPAHAVNQWMPEEDNQHEWKFSFSDMNGDGLKDLVYMASAVTGNGPNGMEVFPANCVYFRVGNQFVLQEELNQQLNELSNLKKIKEFVKQKFN